MEAKKVELAQLENEHSAVQQEHERLQAELNTAEELLQTLLTGLSSSNKTQSGGGYMGQIAEARQRESQGMAEETQNRQKLTMARKSLTEVQAKWREVEREAGEGKKKLERMRQEVEKLHRQVETSGWNEDKERSAGSALRAARDEVRQLTEVSLYSDIVVYILIIASSVVITSRVGFRSWTSATRIHTLTLIGPR